MEESRFVSAAGSAAREGSPRVLVIADDLTGAMDVGAVFESRGVPAVVLTDPQEDWEATWNRFPVIAIDTETRHISAREAWRTVHEAVQRGLGAGATHFFKKTDSTLRGNVGAELNAVVSAVAAGSIAFVPAAPSYGRSTRGGYQYVGGQLLHESAFAKDPLEPANESYVPAILKRQTQLAVRVISIPGLNDPNAYLEEPRGIDLFDAESEEDIAGVVEHLARRNGLRILAGTARFAFHVAGALFPDGGRDEPIRFRPGLLAINGSVNETALRQVRWARDHELFRAVRLSPEILLTGAGRSEVLQSIAESLGRGEPVLVHTICERGELEDYIRRGTELGLEAQQVHLTIANGLGGMVRDLTARHLSGAVGLTAVIGGDTFAALSRAMQWRGFALRGELVPGMALSEVHGCKGTWVATKPGGFGPEHVLGQVRDFFTKRT